MRSGGEARRAWERAARFDGLGKETNDAHLRRQRLVEIFRLLRCSSERCERVGKVLLRLAAQLRRQLLCVRAGEAPAVHLAAGRDGMRLRRATRRRLGALALHRLHERRQRQVALAAVAHLPDVPKPKGVHRLPLRQHERELLSARRHRHRHTHLSERVDPRRPEHLHTSKARMGIVAVHPF